MALPQWLARVTGASSGRGGLDTLLDASQFEHAATCERMRVDRNGSVLAMLLIQLPDGAKHSEQAEHLATLLDSRLRLTDTAGLLRDGRFGVLLPDTPFDGAWKVAQDINAALCGTAKFETAAGDAVEENPPVPQQQAAFEVLIYPDGSSDEPWQTGPPAGAHPAAQPAAEPVTQPATLQTAEVSSRTVSASGSVPATGVESGPACRASSFDALFVRPTPFWKRATDVFVGTLGLTVAAPVVAACAGAVALTSKGSPFFVQYREGAGGRRFKMYKIRTMEVDADSRKSDLRRHSEQDGPAFKMTRDPRVTRVGRVLRALSLDELPQLLNVVRGEMSLVGPRPLPVDESQRCKPWQRQRLQVAPGITCIWQVRGRNIVPFDEWIRMDLQYIKQRSPLQDARLILETGPSLLFSRGPR
ncbi:MAG: sugar transferase [Planctomycetota bacterium]